jgi:hypothetical protein
MAWCCPGWPPCSTQPWTWANSVPPDQLPSDRRNGSSRVTVARHRSASIALTTIPVDRPLRGLLILHSTHLPPACGHGPTARRRFARAAPRPVLTEARMFIFNRSGHRHVSAAFRIGTCRASCSAANRAMTVRISAPTPWRVMPGLVDGTGACVPATWPAALQCLSALRLGAADCDSAPVGFATKQRPLDGANECDNRHGALPAATSLAGRWRLACG